MAIEQKVYDFTFMEQYRLSDNWWNGGWSPIRAGGTEGYISFLGFPSGARDAVVTSKVPAKVYLRLYFYQGGDFLVGKHQLSSRPLQSTKPYHLALTGWEFTPDLNRYQDYNITGVIRDDLISGNYQGVTMWNNRNTPLSECWGQLNNPLKAWLVIEGDWNVKPDKPAVTFPTFGTRVDKNVIVKWNPPANENPANIRYDLAYSDNNGANWKYIIGATPNGVTSFDLSTVSLAQSMKGLISVRAFDGELYSDWSNSDTFQIYHNLPPQQPTKLLPKAGDVIDRTIINTLSWNADPKVSQMGYSVRWRTVASNGVRGSWNMIPASGYANSTSQYLNVSANTFPASDIEWGVSTQDEFGGNSAYSSEILFTSANPSSAPIMVYPTNNAVHPQAKMTAEWTASGQTQFEFFLKNSGGTTLWSTTGTTAKSVMIPTTLVTGSAYKLQVRVNVNGIWSAWTEPNFTVNFAKPATPIIQRIEEAGSGVANVVYNQGELGIDLPAITEDGVTLANGWEFRGSVTSPRLKPLTANSYELDLTGAPTNNYGGVTITLDSTKIPIIEGATYEVVGYSNVAGIRAIVWFYGASGNDLGSTADPLGQIAGSGSKTEVRASRVAPAGTAKVRVVFDNVYGSPMVGAITTVSGISLRITSPVATQLIDIFRREYSPMGDQPWEYLGGNPVASTASKNLIPNYNDSRWSILAGDGWSIQEPYKLRINTATANKVARIDINVTAGMWYTFQAVTNSNENFLQWFDSSGGLITSNFGIASLRSVQAPANAVRVQVCLSNGSKINQAVDIGNPMFYETAEQVTVSIPFEPYRLDGIQGGFQDYTLGSHTIYEYKLVAWNLMNKTSSESVFKQFAHTFEETILQDVDDLGTLQFMTMVTSRDSQSDVENELMQFAGRTNPVREYGEHEFSVIDISWEVDTFAEARAFEKMLNARKIYLYRDGAGRKMYVTSESINIGDRLVNGYTMSTKFTKTDYTNPNQPY